MTQVEHVTFCRICEPLCGLVVSVNDGEVVGIRGDNEHPVSRGYLCKKGSAMAEVQRDPDRVRYPMRRVGGPGEFERCTWDEALDDITARLRGIIDRHSRSAVGGYLGNPASLHTGHAYWLSGFMAALGTPHLYTASSQDTSTRFVASHFLYGSAMTVPFPDARRTSFLLVLGGNPLMSKGSLWWVPRVREVLRDVVARGGRVVVVDPRRSETAKAFEHVGIQADTDAWLLLAMLGEIFRSGLADEAWLAANAAGADELRSAALQVPLAEAARRTGIEAARITALARDFATAPSSVAYTRTGVCTQSFGTLTNFLADALNAVTGNLDRPGGWVFGDPPIDSAELAARFGLAGVGTSRSRVGNLPSVVNTMPSAVMPAEITTPGPGQLRALIVGAGNPVLTTPGSADVEAALQQLDLLVSLDLYVTETSKYAHYILPGTTFLERSDLPAAFLGWAATPFVQATKAVVEPPGECREEWKFYDELARRLGLGGPWALRSARFLSRIGLFRPSPMKLLDLLIRTGRHGDRFGLRRRGLSMRKLMDAEHGIVLADHPPVGLLRRKVKHRDRRVHLFHPEIGGEVDRLLASPAADPDFPLRLIGRREFRSHNSWMHNVPSRHRQAPLQVNPVDATVVGIDDGEVVAVRSRDGVIEVPVEITDEVVPGTLTLSHGWGHSGGWRVANDRGGANYNILTAARAEAAEQISGMSHLNGVPVRIERPDVPSR